jgi:hypothetical protein
MYFQPTTGWTCQPQVGPANHRLDLITSRFGHFCVNLLERRHLHRVMIFSFCAQRVGNARSNCILFTRAFKRIVAACDLITFHSALLRGCPELTAPPPRLPVDTWRTKKGVASMQSDFCRLAWQILGPAISSQGSTGPLRFSHTQYGNHLC